MGRQTRSRSRSHSKSDPNLGSTTEESGSQSNSKRKHNSLDSERPESNASKKQKKEINPHDDLAENIEKIANQNPCCYFENNANTLTFGVKPNNKVSAEIDIWCSKEVTIRIIFNNTKEIVYLTHPSYGRLTTKEKTEWLKNFVAYIERIKSNKEELLPGCLNWENHLKCKYNDFNDRLFMPVISFAIQKILNKKFLFLMHNLFIAEFTAPAKHPKEDSTDFSISADQDGESNHHENEENATSNKCCVLHLSVR